MIKSHVGSSSSHQHTTSSLGLEDQHFDASSQPLPCREKELAQIKQNISNRIELSCPYTMYVSGEPGTGKTASVKQVVTELCNEKPGIVSIFINAMKLSQPSKAFEIIFDKVVKGNNRTSKSKTKTTCKTKIETYFKNPKTIGKRPYVIVIIDEMDFFVMNTTNNTKNIHLLYDLVDVTRDANSKLCIIGISNTVSLLDKLHAKIKSRFDDTLTFFPYENEQIRTIVESKILNNYEGYFEKSAIKMIGSIIARKAGDIRRAIDIIKRCIEVYQCTPQTSEKKKIDSIFVKNIASDYADIYPIESLSIYHKIFLYCVIQEYQMKAKTLKENPNAAMTGSSDANPDNILFERVVMRFQNLLAMCTENSTKSSLPSVASSSPNHNNNKNTHLLHLSMDQLEHVMGTCVELGFISIEYDNRERLPLIHLQNDPQEILYSLETDSEMKNVLVR
ncbi:hypothetical protein C9374_011592 [Naegleria lovaniensis]|uniref:Origin recognition complex subunit 1 n=1 Tax=Naegleria lovaniensis TaxID=51637 RepID=A0AA88KIH3_NAELO|nr:uncharacterized protein C9374_011592 [Naegleria lovaniensis]KAG2373927.1 hypothetical protein C9374_011592 [Naegleria lovaniensis]